MRNTNAFDANERCSGKRDGETRSERVRNVHKGVKIHKSISE